MTTYTGPTPYDAEIARAERERNLTLRTSLGLIAEGYRRGFGDAKTEDAPLLEALQRIAAGELGPNAGEVGAETSQAYHAQGIALAAIAAYQGKE